MRIDNIFVQAAWAASLSETAQSPAERWRRIHLSDLRARLARRSGR